jgi:predicted transcriptional regulator
MFHLRKKISEWVHMINKLKSETEYYKKQSEKSKLHSRKTKVNQMEGLRKRMEA